MQMINDIMVVRMFLLINLQLGHYGTKFEESLNIHMLSLKAIFFYLVLTIRFEKSNFTSIQDS